jgi:hypothetical protein
MLFHVHCLVPVVSQAVNDPCGSDARASDFEYRGNNHYGFRIVKNPQLIRTMN